MALLGQAAVAMWWTVETADLGEFQEWHSKEHLPERLAIPGFNRGSRWMRAGSGDFFVIYELADYATLTSDAYRARLNDPTPWSTRMMPLHRDMVRSQCRVATSAGRGIATFMLTVQLSPRPDREHDLRNYLDRSIAELPLRQGITGAPLLQTDTPQVLATKEQRIRGGDAVADWIMLVTGYEHAALSQAEDDILGRASLSDAGAADSASAGPFNLVHAMTPADAKV
ncbi:MAG: hypothetical protein KF849_02560 [Rhizobiaceae bacterium]|nr:hypothetical protein [Rhizobiaceae bacterium]